MRRILAAVLVALLSLVHIETTSAQSTNASVGGFVQDPSQAFIPGVTVTATNTQTGVVTTDLTESTTFAGVSTGMVNTVRDGLSVQNGRYANGVGSVTSLHPDMVSEFRVILTPVDVEVGRGNGQVEILTRSGTNQVHGSGVWSVRNSKLDANTWANNKQVVNGVWTPGAPPWINRNQLTGSVGGPIVKNKTFFFVLWDQQLERQRQTVRPVVLTDCAQIGRASCRERV